MFDLTVLDYIYIGVILASTVWATIRGGVYETIATLSWNVAAISARFVSPYLDELLQKWFNVPESTVVTLIASYFIVFFKFDRVYTRVCDSIQPLYYRDFKFYNQGRGGIDDNGGIDYSSGGGKRIYCV